MKNGTAPNPGRGMSAIADTRDAGAPTPAVGPCPPWCGLVDGHIWDGIHADGRMSRGHQGPGFGKFVTVDATEYSTEPGVFYPGALLRVDDEYSELQLAEVRDLADAALRAAQWLESRREEVGA